MKTKLAIAVAMSVANTEPAYAAETPRPTGQDQRIRDIV